MKSGDIVLDKNGNRRVVYQMYSETECSLCIEGYDTYGDMVECDDVINISDLTPTDEHILGESVGTCHRCGEKVYREIDEEIKETYPYVCMNCDENLFSFEVINLVK